MNVKRWLAVSLTALSCAALAQWTKVDWNNERTFYADPWSVRNAGAMVRISEILDFKSVQTHNARHFLSIRYRTEYDCAAKRFRRLSSTQHSANMAGGEVVGTDNTPLDWAPIPLGTALEALGKLACGMTEK
jgi:hypothetical protein